MRIDEIVKINETIDFHAAELEDMEDGRKRVHWPDDSPQMNIALGNAGDVLNYLELPLEEHGYIPPEELPDLRRKLVKLLNDPSVLTKDTEQSGGETTVDRSGDIPRITKTATMYDIGRDEQQIIHYAERMLEIIKWSMERGYGVSWA